MLTAHLEKVLRHAERKFLDAAQRKPSDLLDLYRRFLKIEEHRLKLEHQRGEGGRETARKRSDLMTVVLRQLWRGAIENTKHVHIKETPRLTLAAVGGFGRGELNPSSDIDILFLYQKKDKDRLTQIQDIVEQVLYILWDVGFEVGHATRTLDEMVELANEDLQTKTALLEARFLCGNEGIWDEFEKSFTRRCLQGREAEYAEWRLSDQTERHKKNGNTVFLQEPNVKSGCGGLRDYQNLLWIARVRRNLRSTLELQEAGLLTPTERKQIDQAYDFLLRIRSELHYQQKRKGDLLTLRLQGQVANSLRYQHKNIMRRIEALMREYYEHANDLFIVANTLARRLAGENLKPKQIRWSFLPGSAVNEEKVDGLILRNNQLEAAEGTSFGSDPLRILRVFVLAQQRGAEIGPELALRLRRRASAIDRRVLYTSAAREIVKTIFSRKGEVGRICRAMHETGVLGRLIPEFAPLYCLVQHEFFHRYTADEHTLVCLEMLDRMVGATENPFAKYRPLMQQVEHPYLLYLAMLLHDTGRSENQRYHAEASAVNAVRVSKRLRLPANELAALVFLVDHHLTLADTAARRNLDDEQTITEFARIVQTKERLDLLMLLTFADSQGTAGQENWSDWKETLIWQLYRKAQQVLEGGREFVLAAQASLTDLRGKLAESLRREIDPAEVEAHFGNLPRGYFQVTSEPKIEQHIRVIHRFLLEQMKPEGHPLCPIIEWVDHPEQGHTEVEVVTWDRPRVFALMTGAFATTGLSILSAQIYTRADNICLDTFRVCTSRRQAVNDDRDRRKFIKILTQAFTDSDFDFNPLQADGLQRSSAMEGVDFPTRVTFDLKASHDYSVLDLQTPDRPGLLYRVATCLDKVNLSVGLARITTEKGAALDTFYLRDGTGRKITDETVLQSVNRKLLKTLES